jgi:hypothetical protein
MLVDVDGKSIFCLKCGSRATKEALFDVDGAMLKEKYCDTCAEKEAKVKEDQSINFCVYLQRLLHHNDL